MRQAVLNNRSRQRGIGLIEVLVALVIFALGVVGMAGLQLRTMSSTMDSTQRSYVIAKSQDIADTIRSNGIPPKDYLRTYNEDDDYCDTPVIGRTVGQIAAFDMYEVFCAGDTDHASTGSYNKQVAEWMVEISCEYPDAVTGVVTPTTSCDEFAAQVVIETSWFARSVDDDLTADPKRDSMTLRFIP